ncbi:MAG: S49 family peptidase, partial [Nitrococcus sp.]|nr:S49 family peptidase [Nitrococcus sp.]
WLAAQASEVVVSPSGEVGSIGVFAVHENMARALAQKGVDVSLISAGKYKTEGHPFGALDETARAAIQANVDAHYRAFINAVAAGRGVGAAVVQENFGEGRMLRAEPALGAGMVDRIESMPALLARLAAAPGAGGRRRSRFAFAFM